MNIVWRAHWSLDPGLSLAVHVLAVAPATYIATIDYPSVRLAGGRTFAFTAQSSPGSWEDILGYFTKCKMTAGWSPAPPPWLPPARACAEPAALPASPRRSARSKASRQLANHGRHTPSQRLPGAPTPPR